MAQRVCVTGASGQAGRAVVTDLREHGYDVLPTDVAVSRADREDGMLQADLTDYGQAVEALTEVDAVVHLANIPAPGLSTPAVTFNSNITMNFNVFQAAAALKLGRVVWASSETTLGLPFDTPPRYAPVDEDHYPLPTSTYALSKVASETIAGHIAEWSGIPFVALRFSNIMAPEDYARLRETGDLSVSNVWESTQEYRMRHADGHWVWVQDTSRPVFDDDGTLVFFQGFLMDVSTRHEAQSSMCACTSAARAGGSSP